MILFLLIAAHFLCDYPLQSDFLAIGKGSFAKPHNGIPWYHCMAAHAWIHGLAVAVILDDWRYGVAELVFHFAIDTLKCLKKTNIHTDQVLHIACKVAWYVIATEVVK